MCNYVQKGGHASTQHAYGSHCFSYYRNSRRRDGTMRALIPSERERYICSHEISLIEDEH